MRIGIVGLGLMGGSLAKALKGTDSCARVLGYDIDGAVLVRARDEDVIDGVLEFNGPDIATQVDVLFIALRPQDAIDFVARHANKLEDILVIDLCGVKRVVTQAIAPLAHTYNFSYIGAHPMAGRERGGYAHSDANLYHGASMIICPTQTAIQEDEDLLGEICKEIGIVEMPRVTPEHHDRLIAYTSQLAHVVSNAFVKSPNAPLHDGFSAGSLLDLTRVARLDAPMWTELFLENADNLLIEIETIRASLAEYESAIRSSNREELCALLSSGSQLKAALDEKMHVSESAYDGQWQREAPEGGESL